MPYLRRLLLVGLALIASGSSAHAQATRPDVAQLSLEDLMSLEVTSAARKEQRAGDIPAAVYVITSEDIRRSGMTTLPDVLRLAPGVNVAQVNANQWSVSVRGFNGLYANKLLVLIDGRSVYNRMLSGVLWNTEDVLVDDIDRIEVIRGPGAAMWGANAVNGVINVVTRTAAATRGGLVRLDGGRFGEQVAARYGGRLGAASYRVFAQWSHTDESLIAAGQRAADAAHSTTTGFRADWGTAAEGLVLEGTLTAGAAHTLWSNLDPGTAATTPIATDASDSTAGVALARWTHRMGSGASVQIQSSADIADRQGPAGNFTRHGFDLDTQYRMALGTHHDVVAGAGYRFADESLVGAVGFALTPENNRASLATAFVQDEIAFFANRLTVALGTQVQYDSDAGAGVQPTLRTIWKVRPNQRLWAAISRALRTPSLTDRGIRVDYPPVPGPAGLPLVVTVSGNPGMQTETLVESEAGYRMELGPTASIDVAAFVGRYDHLRTREPAAPVVQFVPLRRVVVATTFDNLLAATTRGFELSGHWSPAPAWRLDGSYSAFRLTPRLAAVSRDPDAARADGDAPRQQWQVRSTFTPIARATLGLAIFQVGRLEQFNVAAYMRVDVNAEWRFTDRLSAMVGGRNLADAAHPEFSRVGALLQATEVARGVNARLRWEF